MDVYTITAASFDTDPETGKYRVNVNTNRGVLALLLSDDWLFCTRVFQHIGREINAHPEQAFDATMEQLLAAGG